MSLRIIESNFVSQISLTVDSDGIVCYNGTGFFSKKRHRFEQVEAVLLGPDHRLSIQVGGEVFTIQTKPSDTNHQSTIHALLQEVRRSLGAGSAAVA